MRTAQILKLSAYIVIPAGALFGLKFFSVTSAEFWAVLLLSVLLWLILRIIANAGELIFEIRNDFARLFSNIERGLYYSNSLSKEIRDLVESERVERDVH
jgi:cell division protein FtsL